MDSHKQLKIGLFGFGVVGEGLYRVLQQTPSLKAELRRVCIKHSGKKETHLNLYSQQKKIYCLMIPK